MLERDERLVLKKQWSVFLYFYWSAQGLEQVQMLT